MTISELKKSIQEWREVAATDIDSVPLATRGGWQGRINEARTRIAELENKLRQEAVNKAMAIVLFGPKALQDEFADQAEDEGNAISVFAYAFYKRLASAVLDNVGNATALDINHVGFFNRELLAILTELGVNISGEISLTKVVNSPLAAIDLTRVIKDLFDQNNLSDLNRMYVERIVADTVVKSDYVQNVVPVVVVGTYEDDKVTPGTLFTRVAPSVGIELKSEGNIKNQVTLAFKKLAAAFKKAQVTAKE